MVKKILTMFNREYSGLHQAAVILGASSLISGMLGLLRDFLLAKQFGARQALDVYYAAFSIPDSLYTFSLLFVSGTVLIPFFLRELGDSDEKARAFINSIFTVFSFLMVAFVFGSFFLMPFLVKLTVPGFSKDALRETILLGRILLFSPLLLGLSNLFSSVVQSCNRFFIYALSPILYNAGIIFGVTVLAPKYGMRGLAFGVILGACAHLTVQLPVVFRLGFAPKVKFSFNWGDFKKMGEVARLSLPRTIGMGFNQFVVLFITAIASSLSIGSIAIFNLSQNIQTVLFSVIGASYSMAAFPTLARFFASGDKNKFFDHVLSAGRQIIFWSIPASVMLIVLRAQIVRVLLGHGRFDWRDTRLTAACLAMFALALTSQSLIMLLSRAYYAAGRTVRPLVVNGAFSVFIVTVGIGSNKILPSISLAQDFFKTLLRIGDVKDAGVLILASVFSLGMFLNIIFLMKYFGKDFGFSWRGLRQTFFHSFFASLLMGIATYVSLNILDSFFDLTTFVGVFSQGFISASAGFAVWCSVLKILGCVEFLEIVDSLKQKFARPIIVAEPRDIETP